MRIPTLSTDFAEFLRLSKSLEYSLNQLVVQFIS